MDDKFVFVEYLNTINSVVKKTFQLMQRIKLMCFDASPNFLVFGATSGGIYIFRREPCEFVKLIPCKEGSADLIAISRDERHIGIASSRGLILILQNFIEDNSLQYQVFSEHEGRQVTYIKWHRNELYVGDIKGKISIVSVATALTKSIFQIPTAVLMTLDSPIVQIDTFQCYLLISTYTKSYLCNTERENYIQIGKKMRDGPFGACFCNTSSDIGEITVDRNARSAFHSIIENEMITSNHCTNSTKIFCARPGVRLWEVGFDAKVLVTYQFKSTLNDGSNKLFLIGCEEETVLHRKPVNEEEKIPDNYNFQKVYPVCDRFVLTYDLNRICIFDPASSKLIFWTSFATGIKHVAFVKTHFYIWNNNLEINVLSVVELEELIVSTLYRKQFYLCADLCLKFSSVVISLLDESKNLYLLAVLKGKISDESFLQKLQPIFDKVDETNEKLYKRHLKGNIVLVENLHVPDAPHQQIVVEDDKKDLKLILKQYKLNKTHSIIDIPEVTRLFDTFNEEDLFTLLITFIEYLKDEFDGEDATSWCQQQYLKQISKRAKSVENLPMDSFDFLMEAMIEANKTCNHACTCGYPLPKCHGKRPHFDKLALEMLDCRRNAERLLKNVPYLWRYRVKTEIYGLNMTALIQYSDLTLFKEHTLRLKYDNWHDILGYFVKINKSVCLNCDQTINIDSLITWTELSKVIVQSLGAKNTLRILEKYAKVIPNGALDPTFYQTCIFAHTFINDNNTTEAKADVAVQFVDGLDKSGYIQFQDTLAKYFKRKYAANINPCYDFSVDSIGICHMCNLPLKNDILSQCETVKTCGHRCHKFCFDRRDGKCKICSVMI